MKLLSTLIFILFVQISWGQNILFVNDNNNITDNTDTVLMTLQSSIYSGFDYYNASDSATNPSVALLSTYDLVIWYASTDGVGLKLWSSGTAGDADLKNYLIGGGNLWVIGADVLYGGGYLTPSTFGTGEFAYDQMGIESYNVQSQADDGATGVSVLNKSVAAPASFPDTLSWSFATAWWVDGVDVRTGGLNIYEMGPSSYVLAQEVSMTHFQDIETNVLSTFFDPAIISPASLRLEFFEESITYMLPADLGIAEKEHELFSLYPNPATNELNITADNLENSTFEITTVTGKKVKTGEIVNPKIDVQNLPKGVYFITINGATKRFTKL